MKKAISILLSLALAVGLLCHQRAQIVFRLPVQRQGRGFVEVYVHGLFYTS